MVLAERLEVHAEGVPLCGPLEAPRELPLPERGGSLVAAAVNGVVAGLDVLADVVDGAGLEVDAGDGLGEVPAVVTPGEEGDVLVVDLVLEAGEDLACGLAVREDATDLLVEPAALVESGVGDDVDGDADRAGGSLEQFGEVVAVGVTAAERVRDVGVRPAEVPPEGAGVDLAETDDVPLEVGQRPRELPEAVAVVGREHLPDLAAVVPERIGDEVAAHYLVEVPEVRDAGRRDPALDHDGVVGVALEYLVGGGVGPEGALAAGPDVVELTHRGPLRCRRTHRRRRRQSAPGRCRRGRPRGGPSAR